MPSIGLLQGAGSVNPTKDAYDTKAAQLQQKHAEESQAALDAQTRKDNDFHQVAKYAGDGYIDEARYYAKSKGLDVPEQIFTNANLAKGLAFAGDLYGHDPAAAQKFAQVYSMTEGDMQARLAAGQQAAGVPISADDREFNKKKRWAEWEAKNNPSAQTYSNYKTVDNVLYRINPDGTATPVTESQNGAYDAGQSAYEAGLKSMTPGKAGEFRDEAVDYYYQAHPNIQRPQPQAPIVTAPQQSYTPEQIIADAQQALIDGIDPNAVAAEMQRMGVDPNILFGQPQQAPATVNIPEVSGEQYGPAAPQVTRPPPQSGIDWMKNNLRWSPSKGLSRPPQ